MIQAFLLWWMIKNKHLIRDATRTVKKNRKVSGDRGSGGRAPSGVQGQRHGGGPRGRTAQKATNGHAWSLHTQYMHGRRKKKRRKKGGGGRGKKGEKKVGTSEKVGISTKVGKTASLLNKSNMAGIDTAFYYSYEIMLETFWLPHLKKPKD